MTGSVKWFNAGKGYGFITADEGGEDRHSDNPRRELSLGGGEGLGVAAAAAVEAATEERNASNEEEENDII